MQAVPAVLSSIQWSGASLSFVSLGLWRGPIWENSSSDLTGSRSMFYSTPVKNHWTGHLLNTCKQEPELTHMQVMHQGYSEVSFSGFTLFYSLRWHTSLPSLPTVQMRVRFMIGGEMREHCSQLHNTALQHEFLGILCWYGALSVSVQGLEDSLSTKTEHYLNFYWLIAIRKSTLFWSPRVTWPNTTTAIR